MEFITLQCTQSPIVLSHLSALLEAGRYLITYTINPTAAVLVGSRLVINGVPNEASTVLPFVATTSLVGQVLITAVANTTVTLELFGLLGAVILPEDAAGATLSIVRVE